MYDVAVVGGGICGCALAYELSRYDISVALLEKENDVAMGATKANSAIIHAGYDPVPGTAMARLNVWGNRLAGEICKKLDIPFVRCGSLVVAMNGGELETLRILYDRGVKNGVPGLALLTAEETLAREPALSKSICGALCAPTAGIVSPWEMALALAETAVLNGVTLLLKREVSAIQKRNGFFMIQTNKEALEAQFLVNAAGVSAARVNAMLEPGGFSIFPNKGEYFILDKSQGTLVSHVIFQCPTKLGKGVLVAPTVHGNLIVGPNAADTDENDLSTTAQGLSDVRKTAHKSIPAIDFRESIRNFSGLRAHSSSEDFIIGESPACEGFFNIAGIKSPGLTCAPAIAKEAAQMLFAKGLKAAKKPDFTDTRRVTRFNRLSDAERAGLIAENPAYGRIVCRCETVTEGEIAEALRRPIAPVSLDGIKRRCSAGMGRCQGGFCGVRVQEIISRELGVPFESVTLDGEGTFIVTGRTKLRCDAGADIGRPHIIC